ncbi:T9SS type A sorting domain-containing protein [bacterium]|nr:T9SS type A sorting domain-containing protein [bacterium]
MIKKATYLILGLFLALNLSAQTLSPMGEGLPFSPEKLIKHENGIAAIYQDGSDQLQVQVWNGDFWIALPAPELPSIGTTSFGILEFKDFISYKGDLYVCAEHTLDLTNNAPNYILKWNGAEWVDISDEAILNAVSLDYLVEHNGDLLCIGIFSGDIDNFNVARFIGDNWNLEGNLLTTNANDHFEDLTVSNNKVYVTGRFTDPAAGSLSLAEWDGTSWQKTSLPPFLTKNEVLGNFNSNIVAYGSNSFNNEKVKVKNGSSGAWTDISSGLSDYTINEVQSFESADEVLYMIGDFVDKQNTESLQVLEFKNGTWKRSALSNQPISSAIVANDEIIFSGDFEDGDKLNHVGTVIPYAQIKAGVYNDVNGNCVKDADEDWMMYYPINFGSNVSVITDYSGQVYLPVRENNYTIQADPIYYYESTCPSTAVNVDEQKVYSGIQIGVRKKSGIRDATIEISDNQSFKHDLGDEKRVLVCVSNLGSESIKNATVQFKHDENAINFASELPYNSYEDKVATWTLDLEPEEKRCFYVTFTTISAADVKVEANIEIEEKDEEEENNQTSFAYKTGSTGINQKHTYNGDLIPETVEQLRYKIAFTNNTGRNVIEVRVIDEFDHKINPYTLARTGISSNTSHVDMADIKLNVIPAIDDKTGNYVYKLEWVFSSFELPPFNESPDDAEGFVDITVNVRPNKFKVGEQLCNTALIYFIPEKDYNPEPIKTNTVCSSVGVEGTTNNTGKEPVIKGLSIGPNPSTGVLELDNATGESYTLHFTNALGQEIMTVDAAANTTQTVSLEHLGPGVYFVHTNGVSVTKLIVR